MSQLFKKDTFAGFGPSRLYPADYLSESPRPTGRVRGASPCRLRAGVRELAPRRPGVYGMLDARRRLVYVGKAKSLRSRLMSYFRESSDHKAGRILEPTRWIVWEEAPGEFAALLRELELIRRWRPRFNVLGQPGRQRVSYLCVGRKPAATVYPSRRPEGPEGDSFGPVPGMHRAREATRRLNDLFGLRDCAQRVKMHFAEAAELFPVLRSPQCLRYEIGTCSGPCVGGCTRAEYAAQVRAVKAFLEGADTRKLVALERDMAEAAAAMQYERAAALRDKVTPLRWLADHLGWLREARRQNSFVYPVLGGDGVELWYHIHRGRVWAVGRCPTDDESRRRAAARVRAVYQTADRAGPALPADEVDSVLLVAAWFRRHAAERERLMSPAEALARCEAAELAVP